MSTDLPGPAWEQIRRGVAPDGDALKRVAGAAVATLGVAGVDSVREGLRSRLLGTGPLEPLVKDPAVTDIAVNGDGSVWVDRGRGMERADVDIGGPVELRQLAVRLAGLAGRRLDETAAYVDGQLPSGVRLHAILPPLVADGPHLTLRVPARSRYRLPDLAARGMFPPRWVPLLQALVRERVAFVVSGGTGAGKTTLLGALLAEAGPDERLVVVEDVRELLVDHPQVVRLEARPPNVEGVGAVTLTTLVRQALRMRPDRLTVGEVRGAEVRELLAALNTGHEGGCGTIHANAAADVVSRFEALGALADLSPAAVHAQLTSAVDAVVHVRRGLREGRVTRRIESIGVLTAASSGRPVVADALLLRDGVEEQGPAWPRLRALLRMSDGRPGAQAYDGSGGAQL